MSKVTHTNLSFCFCPTSINKLNDPWNKKKLEQPGVVGQNECVSQAHWKSNCQLCHMLSIKIHVFTLLSAPHCQDTARYSWNVAKFESCRKPWNLHNRALIEPRKKNMAGCFPWDTGCLLGIFISWFMK